MSSPLSFNSTENFRKKLLVRNLPPYNYPGAFSPKSKPAIGDLSIDDLAVIDSPSLVDIGDDQEKLLYVKNAYGPENTNSSYGDVVDINEDQGTQSNLGEYDYYASEPSKTTADSQKDSFIKNLYGPQAGWDDEVNVEDVVRTNIVPLNLVAGSPIEYLRNPIQQRDTYYKFISSLYSPYQILISDDPQGSDGRLTEDSDLMQIGAKLLQRDWKTRRDANVYQQTLGRANVIDAANDPFRALGVLAGRVPLIEPNWNISQPDSIVGKGLDFISRIAGVTPPYSFIPGDYFSLPQKRSFLEQVQRTSLINAGINGVGNIAGAFGATGVQKFVKKLNLPNNRTSSDIFLANTGQGQSSALFNNLEFNDYRPDYRANFLNDLNLGAPSGNYYIGKRTSEPSDIVFPADAMPVDKYGYATQSPVFGYGALGKEYEGPENDFKFGLNTTSTYDTGGVTGGFVWSSDSSEGQYGKRPGPTNDNPSQPTDSSWTATKSTFGSKTSNNSIYQYKSGSILDNTQKLIDAADGSDKKLEHAGNAINQVSKKFSDGYKILSKGSRVVRYSSENNYTEGYEFCRVFTKDTPFYNMGDLQKKDGNIRKFTYSVLDNTYNLNIAPMRGEDSSNMLGNDYASNGPKKYMFSIENLAWRTANRPGYTYDDLANCEKGPNGGRIMWFPPYDMRVDENVSTRWTANEFLGRPEPVYTYNNTTRVGNLSWKIVVDHPSIMNLLIDKELKGQNGEAVNAIVDSFIAGCLKYDIYDLVSKYPQFSLSDIYEIVNKITSVEDYKTEISETPPQIQTEKPKQDDKKLETYKEQELVFYFDNDIPGPAGTRPNYDSTVSVSYDTTYNNYIARKSTILNSQPDSSKTQAMVEFFKVIEDSYNLNKDFTKKLGETLKQGNKVNITILGAASSVATAAYNVKLSERRISSVINWLRTIPIEGGGKIGDYIDNKSLTIKEIAQGETGTVSDINNNSVNCNNVPSEGVDAEFSQGAMACRRVRIRMDSEIIPQPPTTTETPAEPTTDSNGVTQETPNVVNTNTVQTTESRVRQDIAKRVLRRTLSECNYFDMVQQDSPAVYESIKEKFKYFQPVFHSITPEGLNSRLTFLQQCMRPGDTIPTIQKDSTGRVTRVYNDAFNTAFGAPPVCVLRIGDFYHTKIVINSLSIRYEPLMLDMNPEGIGVQPMIADISLSFNFIGGEGLKEPVAKLQNALSFNYYANTEMYDDRADVTDVSASQFDAQILESITLLNGSTDPRRTTENQRLGGVTIGNTLTEVANVETGALSGTSDYKQIMRDITTHTKEYAESVLSSLEEINNTYLYGGLKLFVNLRDYSDGTVNGVDTNMFGKSAYLQDNVDSTYNFCVTTVDSGTCPLIDYGNFGLFNNSLIDSYKNSIKSLMEEKKNEYVLNMETNLQRLSSDETTLIFDIDKLNYVVTESAGSNTGSDGYQTKQGSTVIFSISGTSDVDVSSPGTPLDTLEELSNDFSVIGSDMRELYTKLESYYLITTFSNEWNDNFTYSVYPDNTTLKKKSALVRSSKEKRINSPAEVSLFTLLGKDIKDDKNKVFNKLINGMTFKNNRQKERFSKELNEILDELQLYYESAYVESVKAFDSFKNEYFNKKFSQYLPYNQDKSRNFTFSKIEDSTLSNDLVTLYETLNTGDKSTFNGKKRLK
jgi:outer membrane protein OmpA-like peptidoglycan-associated protein